MADDLEMQLALNVELSQLISRIRLLSTLMDTARMQMEDVYLDSDAPGATQAKGAASDLFARMKW